MKNIKKLSKVISLLDAEDIPVILSLSKKYYKVIYKEVAKKLGVKTFHYRPTLNGACVTYLKGEEKESVYKTWQEWAKFLLGSNKPHKKTKIEAPKNEAPVADHAAELQQAHEEFQKALKNNE